MAPGDPDGETRVISLVRISRDEEMRPLQDRERGFQATSFSHQLLQDKVTTFFATFLPASVALPRWQFAADEIFRTLVPLLLELQALEIAFPFCDISPLILMTTVHAAVVCTKAAIANCPALATPELTAVLAELTTTLRRVALAFCPTLSAPLQIQAPASNAVHSLATSAASTSIIVVRQTPTIVVTTESPDSLWAISQLRRQEKLFFTALYAYFTSFMPAPVPIPRVVLAGAEILRTLAAMPEALLAIQPGTVLDINPKDTLTLAEIALTATVAAIKACPTLATSEVTTVTAAVSRALRQAKRAYTRSFSPSIIIDITEDTMPLLLDEAKNPHEPTTSVPCENALAPVDSTVSADAPVSPTPCPALHLCCSSCHR